MRRSCDHTTNEELKIRRTAPSSRRPACRCQERKTCGPLLPRHVMSVIDWRGRNPGGGTAAQAVNSTLPPPRRRFVISKPTIAVDARSPRASHPVALRSIPQGYTVTSAIVQDKDDHPQSAVGEPRLAARRHGFQYLGSVIGVSGFIICYSRAADSMGIGTPNLVRGSRNSLCAAAWV